jgi:hypothetical protein
MMETQIIPDDQWIEFFDRFSREYAGWTTTIQVLDRQSGPQNVAENLPLLGISFDSKGTRPCAIEISAGDQPAQHVTHVVDLPLHIRQAQESDGSIDVQIEPATGPITLVHLRGPIH